MTISRTYPHSGLYPHRIHRSKKNHYKRIYNKFYPNKPIAKEKLEKIKLKELQDEIIN
jgi:hypothetical protein